MLDRWHCFSHVYMLYPYDVEFRPFVCLEAMVAESRIQVGSGPAFNSRIFNINS